MSDVRFWPSTMSDSIAGVDPDQVVAADHAAAGAEQPLEIRLRRRPVAADRRRRSVGGARRQILLVALHLVLFHRRGFRVGQHQPVPVLGRAIDGVMVATLKIPCRSGWPSGMRGPGTVSSARAGACAARAGQRRARPGRPPRRSIQLNEIYECACRDSPR